MNFGTVTIFVLAVAVCVECRWNFNPFSQVPTVTYQCADCKTLLVTFNTNQPKQFEISCGAAYCVTNGTESKCSKVGSCDDYSPSVPCDEANTRLPDPGSCTQFSFCGSNKMTKTYKCNKGQNFNAATGKCMYGATCTLVKCNTTVENTVEIGPYPGVPELFVECVYERKAIVQKCDKSDESDGHYLTFDPAIKQCLEPCQDVGNFKIKGYGCKKYMACSKNTKNEFERKVEECPDDSVFSEILGSCSTDFGCDEDGPTTTAEPITASTKKHDDDS